MRYHTPPTKHTHFLPHIKKKRLDLSSWLTSKCFKLFAFLAYLRRNEKAVGRLYYYSGRLTNIVDLHTHRLPGESVVKLAEEV